MNKGKSTWIELVIWAVGIEAIGAIVTSILVFREKPLINAALLVFVLFTVLCFIVLGRGARALLRVKEQTPTENGDDGSSGDGTERHPWEVERDEIEIESQPKTPFTEGVASAERPRPPAANASQDEWFKWYDQVTGKGSDKPDPPVDENAPRDIWFHWYHYVTDRQKYKMTLKELAPMMGLAYSTLKKPHAAYQAEYGTEKIPK
ncbi:MAG: hypothetical protein GY832_35500 [Chloroflexi bacterium]|nr:hypothetical protein [Chloroflexota bacterium]